MSRAKHPGVYLKRIRKARGITQESLEAATGVTAQTIGKIERQKTDPHLSTLRLLADGLQVKLEQLERRVGRGRA